MVGARFQLEGVQNEMKKRDKKWKKRLREMEESHRAELDDVDRVLKKSWGLIDEIFFFFLKKFSLSYFL